MSNGPVFVGGAAAGVAAEELLRQGTQLAAQGRFQEAGQFIRRALAADPKVGVGRNIGLAHLLVAAADWAMISSLVPRNTNSLVTTGWMNSLVTGRPVNAEGRPVAWLTYGAIDFLEQKMQPAWRVLEWGCGNSTLWWAPRVREVLSVEHDPAWHGGVAQNAPANAQVVLQTDPDAYVGLAGIAAERKFDAILIDGEARNRCARTAVERIAPDGIIIFDNSDRSEHDEGIAFLRSEGWKRIDFYGAIPSYLYRNCTSIFFKDGAFLGNGPLPSQHYGSLGPTCAQVLDRPNGAVPAG